MRVPESELRNERAQCLREATWIFSASSYDIVEVILRSPGVVNQPNESVWAIRLSPGEKHTRLLALRAGRIVWAPDRDREQPEGEMPMVTAETRDAGNERIHAASYTGPLYLLSYSFKDWLLANMQVAYVEGHEQVPEGEPWHPVFMVTVVGGRGQTQLQCTRCDDAIFKMIQMYCPQFRGAPYETI